MRRIKGWVLDYPFAVLGAIFMGGMLLIGFKNGWS